MRSGAASPGPSSCCSKRLPPSIDLPAVAARSERATVKPRTGAPSAAPTEKRLCYDFDRHGGCEYGADCRFLHGGRPAAKNPGKKLRGKGKDKRERKKDTPPHRRRRDDAKSEDKSPRRKRDPAILQEIDTTAIGNGKA
eukprot:442555-Pleurochrysis_carterae.AAC.1